jgi:DHA1 family bicyclomycin/chloramphenicol resistance-like MFS transporter
VGVLGTGAVAMAIVIAGGMLSAITVLVLVVRPWRLPVDAPEPALAVAH